MSMPADHIQPATFTYPEAAAYLNMSVSTVKRLVADGSLPHVPIRRGVRFRKVDLDEYLARQLRGGDPRRGRK